MGAAGVAVGGVSVFTTTLLVLGGPLLANPLAAVLLGRGVVLLLIEELALLLGGAECGDWATGRGYDPGAGVSV